MQKTTFYIAALALLASFTTVVGQKRYSGIYSGSAGGSKFLAAVTVGGRMLGLDNTTEGLRNALDPSKSTVNSSGKIKGVVPNGTTLTGTINSSFQLKGTFKDGSQSVRLSGKRTLQ